jgi:DNA-directed RNA polymerase III subunit RPC1
MRVDVHAMARLQLDIGLYDIALAIRRTKSLKLGEYSNVTTHGTHIRVIVNDTDAGKARVATTKKEEDFFTRIQNLKRALPSVVIQGYPEANRAIIKKDDKPNAHGVEEVSLLVEGYGLKLCMTTDGVDGTQCKTNSVLEMRDVLGIEAARSTIIEEIRAVMGQMDIDPRHMSLLADVMTYKGDILGITRFGLAKMRDSVLQLASFEKTPDHLFDAAFHMKRDRIEGVSECIIMGQSIGLGTGAFKVVRKLGIDQEDLTTGRKEPVFNTAFKEWINPLPETVPMVTAQS